MNLTDKDVLYNKLKNKAHHEFIDKFVNKFDCYLCL